MQDEFLKPKLPATLVVLGPSTLTAGPVPVDMAGKIPEKPKGPTKVVNLHLVTSLLKVVNLGTHLHDIKGNKEEPNNKDGIEMCLAFHLKEECCSNCMHKDDHWLHDVQETKNLQDFAKALDTVWGQGKGLTEPILEPLHH